MATRLTKIAADFQTTLATQLTAAGTTCSLASIVDDDGNNLPNGNYFFTIDGDQPTNKEHIVCTITGASVASIKTVSRQGVQASGALRTHRVGAQVILTDWAVLNEITNLINGTTALDGSNPLIYDTDPTITDAKHLATKLYVDNTTTAGAPIASTSTKGISKLSVAPVSGTNPIAVGDNDPRIPTTDQKAALAGTGTPNAGNPYVVANDANLTNNVKTTGNQTVGGIKTFTSIPVLPAADPTTSNQAVRKSYVDGLMTVSSGSVSDNGATITYYKQGKLYFGFRCSHSTQSLIAGDATSAARLGALIGFTVATIYHNNAYGPLTYSYGSPNWNGGGGPGNAFYDVLDAILST